MAVDRKELLAFLEELAPRRSAEGWDNVGMLVDMGQAAFSCVMVALDLTVAVAQEAVQRGVDLLITHHPVLLGGTKKLSANDPEQKAVLLLIQYGISLFAAHTNLDAARCGINAYLAELLELENVTCLDSPSARLKKLVVYVPEDHADAVREAVCNAGAGQIGKYAQCSFAAPGEGTFLPIDGAQPYIGQVEKLERVRELRLEMVVPEAVMPDVLAAMRRAHPYEEIAYDIFSIERTDDECGPLRMGELKRSMDGEDLCQYVKERWGLTYIRVAGDLSRRIQRVALISGSGYSQLEQACAASVDAFISGEIKHHIAVHAAEMNMLLLDAGHFETEQIYCARLISSLQERFNGVQYNVEFVSAIHESAPIFLR